MKQLAIAALALSFATPALADVQGEARDLSAAVFANIDENSNGSVDRQEFLLGSPNFFVSIDGDDSGAISMEEMTGWDFGFANLAEKSNRQAAYTTALKTSFIFLDANGNNEISKGEWRLLQSDGFFRSDADNNGILTVDEFVDGFPLLVAIRSAFE